MSRSSDNPCLPASFYSFPSKYLLSSPLLAFREKLLAGGGTYVEEGHDSNHSSPAGAVAQPASTSSSVAPSPYANKTPASMSQKATSAGPGTGNGAPSGNATAAKSGKSVAVAENDEFSSVFGQPLKKVCKGRPCCKKKKQVEQGSDNRCVLWRTARVLVFELSFN